MTLSQFMDAASQLNQHVGNTEFGVGQLTTAQPTYGGLVNTSKFSQLALAVPLGDKQMNDLGPHINMMHRCIMSYDASLHHQMQEFPENAVMHERTREIIRQLMKENDIPSERQLALDVDVSQTTLNRFMKGETDSLDFANLQKLAHYFGLTVSQLIGETAFDEDRKIRVVMLAMQQMPDYKKDMLVEQALRLLNQTNRPPAKRSSTEIDEEPDLIHTGSDPD